MCVCLRGSLVWVCSECGCIRMPTCGWFFLPVSRPIFNGYFLESGNRVWSEKPPRPFPPLLRHSSLADFSAHPRSDSLEMGLGQAVLKSGLGASMQSSFSGLCDRLQPGGGHSLSVKPGMA